MKALVFAAGLGTRMRPLTDDVPKPLLRVSGKPLLEYNLDAVHDFVDEIIIVVGYKAAMIKDFFKDEFKGVPIKYIEQKEQLGTGHALLVAEKELDDRFIIVLGDDFITRSAFEKAVKHDLCVIAAKVANPQRFGILEIKDNIVVGLEEKPENPKSDLANTGSWVMDRRLIDLMKQQPKSPRGEYEITDALKALIKEDKVFCVVIDKGWIPVGYPDDLNKVEDFLKNG